MILKKEHVQIIVASLIMYLLVIFFIGCVCGFGSSLWVDNLFIDKIYVFILTPTILFQLSFVDIHFPMNVIVRMESRRRAVFTALGVKLEVIIINLSLWFICIFVLLVILGNGSIHYNMQYYFVLFIRYLLGFVLLGTLSEIIKNSKYAVIKKNSYIVTNVIIALDIVVFARQLKLYSKYWSQTLFSLVFVDGYCSALILTSVEAILLIYVFNKLKKSDIYVC